MLSIINVGICKLPNNIHFIPVHNVSLTETILNDQEPYPSNHQPQSGYSYMIEKRILTNKTREQNTLNPI